MFFQIFSGTINKIFGQSKVLSEASITTSAPTDNSFALRITYIDNSKIGVESEENFFKKRQSIF